MLSKKNLCIFIIITSNQSDLSPIARSNKKEYIVYDCLADQGMGVTLCYVLALVACYEKGYYAGIKVDFEDHGVYYDKNYGPNWWNYYFEPVCYPAEYNATAIDIENMSCKKQQNNHPTLHRTLHKLHRINNKIIKIHHSKNTLPLFEVQKIELRKAIGDPPRSIPYQSARHTSRIEAYHLIQKYIHPKQHILEKVANFQQKFTNHFIISVHYRGTDRITGGHTKRVPYNKVRDAINTIINHYGNKNYRIFVTSDEQAFLDYMRTTFGAMICYNQDSARSRNNAPVHLNPTNDHYKCGEDAITDCLLLSKGDFLICTPSNLNLWARFFNPNIPCIELS